MTETTKNQDTIEPKAFFTRGRLTILLIIAGILLFLTLFGKNFVQIDTRWFLLFAILGGTYIFIQQYWKRHSRENLYQMLDKIRDKEYKERREILNTDFDNIDAKPIGENLTYVYFKDRAKGFVYDHILNAPIGQLPRDVLGIEKTLRNDEIAKLILSGKINVQKELANE